MRRFQFEIVDPNVAMTADVRESPAPSGPLIPFVPARLNPAEVVGRTVTEWTAIGGSYGMGGPGFLAWSLTGSWLTVAIWGAADWFRLDGRLLSDIFWDKHHRPRPWEDEPVGVFHGLFQGWTLTDLAVGRESMTAVFDDCRTLRLAADPADRPVFEGNGEPRTFDTNDDLRDHVFMAPTAELWI